MTVAMHGGRPFELELQSVSNTDLFRHGHGEDAPVVGQLFDFAETGAFHQLIDFRLSPATHDPELVIAVTGKCPGDHFQLRMPWLPCIDQVPSGQNRLRKPGQRLPNRAVAGEQLVEARDDAQGWAWRDRSYGCAIERVSLSNRAIASIFFRRMSCAP